MPAWPFVFYCLTVKIGTLGERPLLARNGHAASTRFKFAHAGPRLIDAHALFHMRNPPIVIP